MVSLRAARLWSWRCGIDGTEPEDSARTRTTPGCPCAGRCDRSRSRWQSGRSRMPGIGRVRLPGVCASAWCYTSPVPAHRPSAAAHRPAPWTCDVLHTCCPSLRSRGTLPPDTHVWAYLARFDNPIKIASVRIHVIAIAIPVATPSQYSMGMFPPSFVSRRRLETAFKTLREFRFHEHRRITPDTSAPTRLFCATFLEPCIILAATLLALPCAIGMRLSTDDASTGFSLLLLPEAANMRVPLKAHVAPLRPAHFRADLLHASRFVSTDHALHHSPSFLPHVERPKIMGFTS